MNNKEQLIKETTKLVVISILKEHNLDTNTTNKIIDSINYNNPNHIYLTDNNILSINEYNQRLMYMKQDDFLIKMTNDYIEILFVQDDNIIISLKCDYEYKKYSIEYITKTEERSFTIDQNKMSFIKQKEHTKYSHTFEKINHTDKDYELLSKLISDAVGINEIETEVIDYISSIYPMLGKFIKDNIDQTKSNLLTASHKYRNRIK